MVRLSRFRQIDKPRIRRATIADRDNIARLFHDVWHATQAPLQPLEIAADRSLAFFGARVASPRIRTWVAHDRGGDLVGFAICGQQYLHSLFLAPTARGEKLGARLLAIAERAIAEQGYSVASLSCMMGNNGARRFYEQHGWRVTTSRYYRTTTSAGPAVMPVWRMQKRLSTKR